MSDRCNIHGLRGKFILFWSMLNIIKPKPWGPSKGQSSPQIPKESIDSIFVDVTDRGARDSKTPWTIATKHPQILWGVVWLLVCTEGYNSEQGVYNVITGAYNVFCWKRYARYHADKTNLLINFKTHSDHDVCWLMTPTMAYYTLIPNKSCYMQMKDKIESSSRKVWSLRIPIPVQHGRGNALWTNSQ